MGVGMGHQHHFGKPQNLYDIKQLHSVNRKSSEVKGKIEAEQKGRFFSFPFFYSEQCARTQPMLSIAYCSSIFLVWVGCVCLTLF